MKAEGILSVEEDRLVFEFQKKDTVLEAYKSDLMTDEISFSELDMIEFKKGIFSTKLILHGKRAATFKNLPGSELTVRTLKIKKKDRNTAANISSRVNLELSEMKLKELDE